MCFVGRSRYKSEMGWGLVDCDVTHVEVHHGNTRIFRVLELRARLQIRAPANVQFVNSEG
jgi:hypothetical protein